METMTIFFVAVAALLGWVFITYNGFISAKNRLQEAWADIDVQLKRRYDLIPNLVETVKGYAKHEAETLENVVQARSAATAVNVDASNLTPAMMTAVQTAQDGLVGSLGKLMAIAEQYPDLKANTNFLELQKELSDTEDKIQAARRFYNGTVQNFNTMVESVPSNIIARIFKFTEKAFFELAENSPEKENVKVTF